MDQFTIGEQGALVITNDDDDWRLDVPAEVLPDLRGLVKFGKPGSSFTASSGTIFSIDEDADLAIYGTGPDRWIKWQQFDRLLAALDIAPRAEVAGTDRDWQYKVSGDDEYLYHASSTTYVFQLSSTGDEAKARELAQWFVQHQPAISEADRLYLTGHVPGALSGQCVAKLAEIRAAIEAGTYANAAPVAEPLRWRVDEAARLYFGSHHVYWHTDQVSDQIDMDEAAEPRTFTDMADWLVEHQPAATLEQVAGWGRLDEAAPHVHAFIQQQIAAQAAEVPAYRWYIDDCGDLNFNPSAGDEYVMDFDLARHEGFSRIDAENLAAWFVQHQPAITEDERLALTDQDRTDGGHASAQSARMLKKIKARIEAAATPPAAELPPPFTPGRAEVSDDPAFWLGVAEQSDQTPAARELRVSFTFDPANIQAAKQVYAALELLPYEIRKAVDIR